MPNNEMSPFFPFQVPVKFTVVCQLDDGRFGSASALQQVASDWILRNVDGPLQSMIREYLDHNLVDIEIAPATKSVIEEMRVGMGPSLTPEELESVVQATHLIAVQTSEPSMLQRLGLWTCLSAALACAEVTNAKVVIDTDAHGLLRLDMPFSEFHYRGIPRVAYFIRYSKAPTSNGLTRVTTQGLTRFGIYEIRVDCMPQLLGKELVACIKGVCQSLANLVIGSGQAGPVELHTGQPMETVVTAQIMSIAHGKPPEIAGADFRVRLEPIPGGSGEYPTYLALVPPTQYSGNRDAWLLSLVTNFFKLEDTLGPPVWSDNAAMVAAHERAVATMSDLRRRVDGKQLDISRIGFKRQFPTPNGVGEFMWVSASRWELGKVTGTLVNQSSFGAGVRLGQSVTFDESEIFDWLVTGPNGVEEGAFTDKVLTASAAAYDQSPSSPPGAPSTGSASAGPPKASATPTYVSRRADPAYAERVTQAALEANRQENKNLKRIGKKFQNRWLARTMFPAILGIAVMRWYPIVGVAGLGIAVWQGILAAGNWKRLKLAVAAPTELRVYGEFRVATIIMANTALFKPGSKDAPALAAVYPNTGVDPAPLALKINGYRKVETEYSDPRLETARKFLTDEPYVPDARLLLPLEWTDGVPVYAAHIAIKRRHLRKGYIEGMDLPVLFVAGETGTINTIPYGVIDGVR